MKDWPLFLAGAGTAIVCFQIGWTLASKSKRCSCPLHRLARATGAEIQSGHRMPVHSHIHLELPPHSPIRDIRPGDLLNLRIDR